MKLLFLQVLLLYTLLLQCVSAESCKNDLSSGYTTDVLDASINFEVSHKVVGSTLHLSLSADHDGWLGFGLAEQTAGHMKGADMVTVQILSDGTVQAQDRYADYEGTSYVLSSNTLSFPGLTAYEDSNNDWTIVSGERDSSTTTMQVDLTRALDTGDTQDRAVGLGPRRIIWAWGSGNTVVYHGSNRGSSFVTFRPDSSNTSPDSYTATIPSYDGYWDVNFGTYTIPTDVTSYSCVSFSLPADQERHIVAFEATSYSEYGHHAIVAYHQNTSTWRQYLPENNGPEVCGVMGDQDTENYVWVWTPGQDLLSFPDQAGYIVNSQRFTYNLEIHFDNPEQTSGAMADFTMRIYYVETLRQYNVGILNIGDPTVSYSSATTAVGEAFGSLPQGQSHIHRWGTCPSECTQSFPHDLTVFGVFQHAHYFGKLLILEHYDSSSTFLDNRGVIEFWDNGYQETNMGTDFQFTIARGDILQQHCVYDTTNAEDEVVFGQATQEEMCMSFLYYYPEVSLGVNAAGDNVTLMYCSGRVQGNEFGTLCGGSEQVTPSLYSSTGQVDLQTTNMSTSFGKSTISGPGQDGTYTCEDVSPAASIFTITTSPVWLMAFAALSSILLSLANIDLN